MIGSVETIRKRPAMYVGGTDEIGLHNILFGLVHNTIDQFALGRATRGRMVLHRDGSATWEDDSPGLDVSPVPEFDDRSLAEVVFTEFYAGGRLVRGAPHPSGATWMSDTGTIILNALSEWLQVLIWRNGRETRLRFARGERQEPQATMGTSHAAGIRIRFRPDADIFKQVRFDGRMIARRLRELAFLNGGLRIELVDEQHALSESHCYPDGLAAFVRELNRSQFPFYEPIMSANSAEVDGITVDFSIQHNSGFATATRYFVNNEQVASGTHVRGFHQGLCRAVSRYGREHGILEGTRVRASDICEGLAAVLSLRLRDPWFEAPTRSKLANPQVEAVVRSAVESAAADFLKAHPAIAEQIVSKAACAASARRTAEEIVCDSPRQVLSQPETLMETTD